MKVNQTILNIAFSVVLIILSVKINHLKNEVENIKPPDIKVEIIEDKPSFYSKSPQEGLMEALEYCGVKHPQIVYAQAILETGHFKSDLCLNGNNLFGLYNSKKHKYYTFAHWTESVVAYLDYVQYRYKPPNDYYKFLSDIGYAEDPHYINKVKEIVKQNDKRRSKQPSIVSN